MKINQRMTFPVFSQSRGAKNKIVEVVLPANLTKLNSWSHHSFRPQISTWQRKVKAVSAMPWASLRVTILKKNSFWQGAMIHASVSRMYRRWRYCSVSPLVNSWTVSLYNSFNIQTPDSKPRWDSRPIRMALFCSLSFKTLVATRLWRPCSGCPSFLSVF